MKSQNCKKRFRDPIKNGVLAVQTLRNSIMASTLLATAAITMSSIIGVFFSSSSNSSNSPTDLIYGNKTRLAIRYYVHVSFLVTMPTPRVGGEESISYITRSLNRGNYFWSFGLRAFYRLNGDNPNDDFEEDDLPIQF
ncbi:Protein of unknown function DUF599 [Macleaya cordata]|uniref:Uncharacterized protein n=1 Tax=Macleaya cordata TaxID=56857 RepID=A0A200QUX0_MACCD|nr:Protein of unknown function DUF599 [Macleaya cordata]